jgi:hypothetical protein
VLGKKPLCGRSPQDCQCGFQHNRLTTYQIFCIRQILEKKWEYNETVHQLFIDFKKVYDSVRREVLYNILIKFGVRLIKMCLNETYSKVHIGKHLSYSFPIQNGLKQGDVLSQLIFNFALEYAMPLGKPGGTETKWDTTASGLC